MTAVWRHFWQTGRGFDTLHLAQIVGAEGTVIGLDVQVCRRPPDCHKHVQISGMLTLIYG